MVILHTLYQCAHEKQKNNRRYCYNKLDDNKFIRKILYIINFNCDLYFNVVVEKLINFDSFPALLGSCVDYATVENNYCYRRIYEMGFVYFIDGLAVVLSLSCHMSPRIRT